MSPTTRLAAIELQDRDVQLLRGLFESRAMTLAHIAVIYFAGHAEAAKKRVQKLKAAGLIGERPRERTYDRGVLFLTKRAFTELTERDALTGYPKLSWPRLEKRVRVSPLTLAHELEVMDVKAAFVAAAATMPGLSITEFSTWPLLSQFRAARPSAGQVLVKPDGFVRFREERPDGQTYEHAFFLEVDRSTETQDTLAMRAACYVDYYRRGGFAAPMPK